MRDIQATIDALERKARDRAVTEPERGALLDKVAQLRAANPPSPPPRPPRVATAADEPERWFFAATTTTTSTQAFGSTGTFTFTVSAT